MLISQDRYQRDRLRYDVALRLMQHEARTGTIREWTALSESQIRNLYHSYAEYGARPLKRHRGRVPHQPSALLRPAERRQQATVLACMYASAGLLTREETQSPDLVGLQRAQQLCDVYDYYVLAVQTPLLSFEQGLLLQRTLSGGKELTLASCVGCSGPILADGYSLSRPICLTCAREREETAPRLTACGHST